MTLLVLLKRRSVIETTGSRRERPPRPNGVTAPSAKRAPEAVGHGQPLPAGSQLELGGGHSFVPDRLQAGS